MAMVSMTEAPGEEIYRDAESRMSRREPLIFVVSGETSGDNLAGGLMAALKHQTGDRVRFVGVGGPQSEQQGLTSLFP